jgi:hypothetical protein
VTCCRHEHLVNAILAGSMACLGVRVFVWIIGFTHFGIRRESMASYVVMRGPVKSNSWTAVMQSVGAVGLRPVRAFRVFMRGVCLYLLYLVYVNRDELRSILPWK